MTTMRQVTFTAHRQAALLDVPAPDGPPAPFNIRGKSLVSLTSPGTELNWGYLGNKFPTGTGYANVLEVVEVGNSVAKIRPGEIVFGPGSHAEIVEVGEADAIPVPPGLSPEVAVFSRLMGVSMNLLHAVFHRYVVLRSGWEWEIPKESRAFAFNSICGNIAAAMDWLSEGSIKVAPLGATYDPADCQNVYSGLLDRSLPTPSAIFDWRL